MRHQMGSASRRLPCIQHLSAPEVNGRPEKYANPYFLSFVADLYYFSFLLGAVYYFSMFFVFYRKVVNSTCSHQMHINFN
jgi:hypothetical protein